MLTSKYGIQFGKNEKESPDEYNFITIKLNLSTVAINEVNADISFEIESGIKVDQFDMDRTSSFKKLTLEETKELVKKLSNFIETGGKFLTDYQTKG